MQNFSGGTMDSKEKELLYKVIFDIKKEINDLRQMVLGGTQNNAVFEVNQSVQHNNDFSAYPIQQNENAIIHQIEEVEESLSLAEKEKEFIIKALEKHRNKRKNAAKELGISERTLYRKIKEYDIQ
jgi:transcriptional regulator with PAS, ATPase and Fis domain